MDGDRKYRQNGYQDSGRDHSNGHNGHFERRDDRPRQNGPRPPLDVTGPRLPRMVQAVTASRCYNCATTLPPGTDFASTCPKCNAALHCCKQCAYFEPSTRFQCLKPVPVRISPKDTANTCELFKARVTVARDGAPAPQFSPAAVSPHIAEPKNATDARAAFDNLFKK
jgi:hypothetical protein